MSKAIRAGFFAKLTGDSTLTSLLASSASVYHAIAPANAAYPLVVFHRQSGIPQYTFGLDAWEDQIWLIKGVDRGTTANVVDDIAIRLDGLLTGGTLMISGQTPMGIWRQSDLEYVEVHEGQQFRHAGGLYRLRVT